MPRRRIPTISIPSRPDHRRGRGNATDAQHRPRRRRRGEVETIAERRVIALRLRKAGGSYREIAGQLGVDVATAYADVRAELGALREQTVEEAKELRDLELQRLDEMTAGLWPQIQKGSPPAVTAAIRVSERRSRLLGLDEPVVTKSELTGSLSLTAQPQLKALAEELRWFNLDELEELAQKTDRLFTDAIAASKARRTATLVGVSLSSAPIDDIVAGESTEPSAAATVSDERDATRAKTAPRDTP